MKYLYQRNNGIITKYENIQDDIYVDTNTGLCAYKDGTILLGKVSENIFDLLESQDFVILEYYVRKYGKRIKRKFEIYKTDSKSNLINFNNIHCTFLYDLNKKEFVDGKGFNVKIKKVITKEQFENMEFEV